MSKGWEARRPAFMASRETADGAYAVLIGAPMDWTASFRPGSRFGPAAIRAVSDGIEEYSVYQDRSLEEVAFHDAGDLVLPFGNAKASLEIIEAAAADLWTAGHFPLFLGGEHLITLGVLRAATRRYPELAVFHLDAHADLRPGYMGERESHASVMRRALEECPGLTLYQFGIRSGTAEEFALAREKTQLYPFEVVEPLYGVCSELEERPVYLTLDIDVVDPAFAPGTGTPEPGGITSRELLDALHVLKGVNLVGCDLVEVSPPYDQSSRTAVLAAEVVRELLLQVSPGPSKK
ncbi:MAG: agmatinase [Betaproteobacteria bacterium]